MLVARRLKTGTGDLHARAERHVRILDPDATTDTYTRYLQRMWGFHHPLEERFAAHAELEAHGYHAASRSKCAWILQDLAALDRPGAPPRCPDLPDTAPLARAVGAAYVLEGSMLGGAFVLRYLRRNLGDAVHGATRFLEGYRGETGARWRAFCALADRAVPEGAIDVALAGARDTFERLIDWLGEPAREPPVPYWKSA